MTVRYRTRSEDTWDRARDAYLAGEPAESVCSRFDLGLRTFRARAAEQGWRRADRPDPEPFEIDEGAALDDEVDDAELRCLARRRMALAARRGLVAEALRWARFGEMVAHQARMAAREARDLAREQVRADREDNQRTNALLRDVTATARTIEASVRAVVAGDRIRSMPNGRQDLHPLHTLHPVSDSEGPDEAPDAPLNRAARRRMLRPGRKRR